MLSIGKGNKSVHAFIAKGNRPVHAVHGKVVEGGVGQYMLFCSLSFLLTYTM